MVQGPEQIGSGSAGGAAFAVFGNHHAAAGSCFILCAEIAPHKNILH